MIEVDRQFAEGTSDAVVIDNRTAAYNTTKHLVELGHRRIALFIDETAWTTGRDRHAGYAAALAEAGIEHDSGLVIPTGWDVGAARATARDLLRTSARPTAIFAANNVLAEGAWRAARDLALTVPTDLSLVSFDDAPWMSMVTPGITAVAQDAFALGTASIAALLQRIAEPGGEPRTVVLPATLTQRGSTAPPPVAFPAPTAG